MPFKYLKTLNRWRNKLKEFGFQTKTILVEFSSLIIQSETFNLILFFIYFDYFELFMSYKRIKEFLKRYFQTRIFKQEYKKKLQSFLTKKNFQREIFQETF